MGCSPGRCRRQAGDSCCTQGGKQPLPGHCSPQGAGQGQLQDLSAAGVDAQGVDGVAQPAPTRREGCQWSCSARAAWQASCRAERAQHRRKRAHVSPASQAQVPRKWVTRGPSSVMMLMWE